MMAAAQHAGLSAERFSRFTRGQQLMAIANEMNRASKLLASADRERLNCSYERVLALADLTVLVNNSGSLRRELLLWRDLVAALRAAEETDSRAHAVAFRALLQFHPETWRQLPFVTGAA